VIAVLHFRPTEGYEAFLDRGAAALAALAARPGFVTGNFGRSTDDESAWVLVTEWESVGAYRRALGGYEVKLIATPLMAQALDQPSAFETLISAGPDAMTAVRASDRAPDADWVGRGGIGEDSG
jgi:quinol monooxygenase YgiN